MMRKLTATGLAAPAVAGVAGTGAAFASASRPSRAAASTEARSNQGFGQSSATAGDRYIDCSAVEPVPFSLHLADLPKELALLQ